MKQTYGFALVQPFVASNSSFFSLQSFLLAPRALIHKSEFPSAPSHSFSADTLQHTQACITGEGAKKTEEVNNKLTQ